MASIVHRICVQAGRTFSKHADRSKFGDNFKLLKDLVSQATSSDVNYDHSFARNRDAELIKENSQQSPPVNHEFPPNLLEHAPVTYVHIYEDDTFTLGIFILHRGSRIPLHDHPGMHGLIRVLHGVASVFSYNRDPSQREVPESVRQNLPSWQRKTVVMPVQLQSKSEMSASDPPCVLTPEMGNFHEIQAKDGPVAFLDILAPPYNHTEGRECHYYRELDVNSGRPFHPKNGECRYLIEAGQPHDFWCDSLVYQGPKIPTDIAKHWL